MRKRNYCCFTAVAMAIIIFILFVCGSISTHSSTAAARTHFRVSGKALYKLDISWPKQPELFTGQVFSVAVNHLAGVVYVAQRGENVPKVLVFSTDGDFIQAWNTSTLEMPHGIFLADPSTEPSVWITDVGTGPYGHTVKQYSPSGKLLQVLGSPGKAGSSLGPIQFDQPAEIFLHSSGEIYIVDGDGGINNRLMKLSKDLQVLWMHGERGQGLAQFYIPHSVAVDTCQRVWVADRGNKRIQVFNSVTGDWLGSWGSCFKDDAPYSVRLTPDQKYLVVTQLNVNQITLLEAPPVGIIGQCQVVSTIQLADDVKPHLVDLDQSNGDLYVAEIGAGQAQKFIPMNTGSV
ncbi:NHL repeat-containing protein 3-like [Triplophysa dalaica]|uniref:NHL repeat-containing protein 3-like n=1 Tax=Triplophysa dalaica TaxID=1582913 RepID=UPI0024DFD810|nr:NHL repeat-containing protein 3-like [Triplophysa dalaica]